MSMMDRIITEESRVRKLERWEKTGERSIRSEFLFQLTESCRFLINTRESKWNQTSLKHRTSERCFLSCDKNKIHLTHAAMLQHQKSAASQFRIWLSSKTDGICSAKLNKSEAKVIQMSSNVSLLPVTYLPYDLWLRYKCVSELGVAFCSVFAVLPASGALWDVMCRLAASLTFSCQADLPLPAWQNSCTHTHPLFTCVRDECGISRI